MWGVWAEFVVGGGWGEKDMLSLQAVFGGMSQDLKLLIQDHLQV